MPLASDIASKRRERRVVMAIGAIVASLPIAFQILMAAAIQLHGAAFPHADRTLTDARFWPVQIVLLCVSVAGNAAVDWIRAMRRAGFQPGKSLTYFLLLVLDFVLVSIMFSVSLLDGQIGWTWIAAMSVVAAIDLLLAWTLAMELAIIDV